MCPTASQRHSDSYQKLSYCGGPSCGDFDEVLVVTWQFLELLTLQTSCRSRVCKTCATLEFDEPQNITLPQEKRKKKRGKETSMLLLCCGMSVHHFPYPYLCGHGRDLMDCIMSYLLKKRKEKETHCFSTVLPCTFSHLKCGEP
jgi:hypothetical protein